MPCRRIPARDVSISVVRRDGGALDVGSLLGRLPREILRERSLRDRALFFGSSPFGAAVEVGAHALEALERCGVGSNTRLDVQTLTVGTWLIGIKHRAVTSVAAVDGHVRGRADGRRDRNQHGSAQPLRQETHLVRVGEQ